MINDFSHPSTWRDCPCRISILCPISCKELSLISIGVNGMLIHHVYTTDLGKRSFFTSISDIYLWSCGWNHSSSVISSERPDCFQFKMAQCFGPWRVACDHHWQVNGRSSIWNLHDRSRYYRNVLMPMHCATPPPLEAITVLLYVTRTPACFRSIPRNLIAGLHVLLHGGIKFKSWDGLSDFRLRKLVRGL